MILALAMCLAAPVTAHGPKGHEDEEAEQVVEAGPEQASASTQVTPQTAETQDPREPRFGKALTNIHPATVHFPIALLLFAALAEFVGIGRGETRLRPAASVMAAIGGVGATVAAIFGWIHTGLWFGGGDAMQWHRWIGTALGLAGPLIAWLALRREGSRALLRVFLAMAAIAVLAQGWLGGELGHGAGHLWA